MRKINLKNPTLWTDKCLLSGRWVGVSGENTIIVHNPATGDVVGSVPSLEPEQVEAALIGAQAGFEDWRLRSPDERSSILRRWYDLMLANKEDLATIMTLEQGKPLAEARAEVDYAASFVAWFSEEARRCHGEVIPAQRQHQQLLAVPEPVGVSVAITPWNFPAAMITRKAGAALAAGCSMVVKPSGLTPFSALALGVLAQQAGVPSGVFSVITGDSSMIGEAVAGSPLVKKLSFTGSTGVGRKLMAQCSANLQKLSLELGGNAPFIVFDDADLQKAVEGAIASKFRNAGQTCICPNRFLIQSGVHNKFADLLSEALNRLKIGDGFAEGVQLCSLINDNAVAKVRQHFDDALQKGGQCVLGERPGCLADNRVAPVIVTGISTDMKCWQEETFGPFVAIKTFDSEAEAIELANNTAYGLASYFYSTDASRVLRVSKALRAGMVGVNEGAISNAMAPFGGIGHSGFGREGGRQGIAEYQAIKYICHSQ
ncbi:NAD-dependent succinate-semialdehyde dehydrogenase [Gilvimarinus sp. SDUM040013]|uniref:NAD-dependent succinate-semialdehyde dehydrogenase n=1 Tax=Gilvimarinus gilvus TaxID=3058038 RepID=A0ABU4RWZ0_9GAMM|nr:NAD-dependent succinate-semialdehyde dehydrogenase [Gilvimarinus sp. SDUM040013]MDO3385762.1 NAD-dependent succinate-semialdehyde dehydrogenase [Gilvimarinus sp. SDUM040013]MDX6849402.1 NAD-dependent succinate-semialdehyde dehydrogenase [Gilvimarinus sp. SDUM040013]